MLLSQVIFFFSIIMYFYLFCPWGFCSMTHKLLLYIWKVLLVFWNANKKWTLWSQDILTFTSFITLLKYFFKFFSSLVGKQVLFVLLYFQVRFFLSLSKWKKALIAQSCWTLWDPMDCSPPGSSVYGILQARILGWNAIPFSRGCSWLREIPWSRAW